ncbi:MAG: hypothetical protein NC210_06645 [[Clostridium] fimetarium]|nr:hypothetical protein [Alistipes timonensis]MCM1406082.1 hypothetical protein [[Clostridium] fimetarium]
MSMEHKAFLFDTDKFYAEIKPVMDESVENIEAAREYINEHLDEFQSPYSGEPLEEDWEEEFDELTLQVYFDILLTACYDVDDDRGLVDMWDAVNEVIKSLDIFDDGSVPVTGRSFEANGVTVDPGMEGTGLIDRDEVEGILNVLTNNREAAEDAEPDPEEMLYEADPEEWMEAYDDLLALYEYALSQRKGLLFTF